MNKQRGAGQICSIISKHFPHFSKIGNSSDSLKLPIVWIKAGRTSSSAYTESVI